MADRSVTFCPGVLTCPVCGEPLSEDAEDGPVDASSSRTGTLRCARQHTFDRAREGYVHLLPAGHGRSRLMGDTRAMVTARHRFLERGFYEPLSDAINVHALGPLAAGRPSGRGVAVDVGCGDGYYIGRLARAAEALEAGGPDRACFYGLDVSREAVRVAARANPGVCFLVNDVKHRICIADGTTDVLLNVFAPRSQSEFARVLHPDGLLLVAVPGEAHLGELRALVSLLEIEEDKPERTVERLAGGFELAGRESLEYDRQIPGADLLDLLRMTPNHWHLDDEGLAGVARLEGLRVTISMLLLRFRPRPA